MYQELARKSMYQELARILFLGNQWEINVPGTSADSIFGKSMYQELARILFLGESRIDVPGTSARIQELARGFYFCSPLRIPQTPIQSPLPPITLKKSMKINENQ